MDWPIGLLRTWQPATTRAEIPERGGERLKERDVLPKVEATVFLKLHLESGIPSYLTFQGREVSLDHDKNKDTSLGD